MSFLNFFIACRSTHPNSIFREQVIRIIVLITLIFFTFFAIIDLFRGMVTSEIIWYSVIYGLNFLMLGMLYAGKINLASRIMMLGMVLIVIDTTVAYWSPGTVVFGLIFTFLAQVILTETIDRTIAVIFNLGIYSYFALGATAPSPLNPNDYFSNPLTAMITVYTAHFILIGATIVIRREQQIHDKMELLLEQQRADLLQQFLGHTSHDLRTLLTRISSSLYLVKKKLPEAHQNDIAKLEASTSDLEKVLLSMLEMSQLYNDHQLERTTYPLANLIEHEIQGSTNAVNDKSLQIIFINQTPDLKINVDAKNISRALRNIIDNSITHTPANGTITITTQRDHHHVLIEIQDTGVGIHDTQLPYIFDSFYRGDRARNQSTGLNGLGLAISRKIIELHGGTITATSIVNEGSTFSIRLPVT